MLQSTTTQPAAALFSLLARKADRDRLILPPHGAFARLSTTQDLQACAAATSQHAASIFTTELSHAHG